MIVICDAQNTQPDAPADRGIAAQDLLFACATEMRRQAAEMAALDAALGRLLELWNGSASQPGAQPGLLPSHLRDLQKADQLRQESEGLATILDLLAQAGGSLTTIRFEAIRAGTPLRDQQTRLLHSANCAAGPAGRGDADHQAP